MTSRLGSAVLEEVLPGAVWAVTHMGSRLQVLKNQCLWKVANPLRAIRLHPGGAGSFGSAEILRVSCRGNVSNACGYKYLMLPLAGLAQGRPELSFELSF